ncbi:MAG TPA: sugar ABC transporter substrate-binding protein [Polyangia bacterium]|nr:sugar ABC transporter substrate-binding protein [Polyangia bacterium]
MAREVIGLFLRSLENDYQQRLRDDALATASHLGFQVKVFSAHNDPAKQTGQIAKAMTGKGSDELAAVLVSPVFDESLAEAAHTAGTAGIGWALLNREASYLERLRTEYPQLPIFSATPDQVEIGHLQALQAKAVLPSGGHVLYIRGPASTSSARRRMEGMQQEIEGALWTVTTLDSDWTSEGARLVVEGWLEGPGLELPRPGIVCAQNDDMALGARQALRDAGSRRNDTQLAEVPVAGVDGSPGFGKRLVKEKRLLATVEVPSASGPAMQWIARARDGGELPPEMVMLPVNSVPALHEIPAK